MMILSDNTMRSFQVAAAYRENHEGSKSFDFSPDGLRIMTAGAHNNIVIYYCEENVYPISLPCRHFGVDLVRFCFDPETAIHTSKSDDRHHIRHISLHSNQFLRYFRGHKRAIASLSISPDHNVFSSASLDKTVKIWDVRVSNCTKTIKIGGRPLTAYAPSGYMLGVGKNSTSILLYDLRALDRGPLKTYTLPKRRDCDWTDVKFNPNGRSILVSTNGSVTTLIESHNGEIVHTFKGYPNTGRVPIEASFTPDSRYVLCGSSDGRIYVYNAAFGFTVSVLESSDHQGPIGPAARPVQCVKFNPRHPLMASTSVNMSIWTPYGNYSTVRFMHY